MKISFVIFDNNYHSNTAFELILCMKNNKVFIMATFLLTYRNNLANIIQQKNHPCPYLITIWMVDYLET